VFSNFQVQTLIDISGSIITIQNSLINGITQYVNEGELIIVTSQSTLNIDSLTVTNQN
jgi:hypothetical protein